MVVNVILAVVHDLTRQAPSVLHVAHGGYRAALGEAGCARVEVVAMDMWPAYIGAVAARTEARVAFDKFDVARHLAEAVDAVRRTEDRTLRQAGDTRLVHTRYLWLTRRSKMSPWQRRAFTPLRTSTLRVAKARAITEMAMRL